MFLQKNDHSSCLINMADTTMTEAKKQEFVDASREKFLLFNNGRHRIGGICPYALVSYSREKVGASQTFIVISFATSLDFAKKKKEMK